MTVITELVVSALIVSLLLASLRRFYEWMFPAASNIPSPPSYPIFRHLPYFWGGFNDEKMLMQWAEDFKEEGIFEFDILLGFVETFDSHTENLIKYWKNAMKKSLTGVAEVEIIKDFNKLTLDIIGETAFGYRFDTLVSGENRVSQAVETLLKGKIGVLSRFLRRIIPFYDKLPLQQNRMMKEAVELTDSVVKKIIKQKRSEVEDSGGKVSGNNLLAKMIMLQDEDSGRKLSDQMIEAQVHTFMVAGHETTSVALTWTFYLLAKHQDIQEKARQEARSIVGDAECIDQSHLDKLEYITAVINESLRMYPPAALFMRVVVTDDQLGQYKIPKGSFVVVPICVLHHLEENWENHDQFIPERFLGEKQISNYSFMPFSNGPRNCIGRKFAMVEIKVAVTKLLMTFKFDLDPNQGEIGTNLRLTLKPNPSPILRVSLVNN